MLVRILVLSFLFSLQACKCVDQREIDNWRWGDFKVKGICPVNSFPILVNPMLNIKEEGEAINQWNKEFSVEVFKIDKNNGIIIQEVPKSHIKYKEYCEGVKLFEDGFFPHVFAWTEFIGSPGKWNIKIYVCLQKFRKAVKLVRTAVADRAKEVGLYGYIKHELGHLLIGPHHPKSYAELMSSNQRNNSLHFHTRRLIQRTVIDMCSK